MTRRERPDLVESIFHAARDLPADERATLLAAACGADEHLRAEVESLLRHHDASAVFFDEPAYADGRGAVAPNAQTVAIHAAGAPRLPSRIGEFSIKSVIASGGMGTVYLAVQDKPRRRVALKVMKRGIASRSALRRFELESQTLARLRHPNVAQVHGAGSHDEGDGAVPFFAMEYVPGAQAITDYAASKGLGTRERLELFTTVCDAVHHGHQKGIIHRDLKPGNILVDSHGVPKIIDFGVARSTDSDLAVTTLQTDLGQLVGTLQYMSPEQCAADPDDIDTRSDVYALGVVLYQLLCDRMPYEVSHAAVHEAARVIREESPARPSTVDRTLRGDIETVTLKALEKERERRYQSAGELARDIEHCLRGEPVAAKRDRAWYVLRKTMRRHKLPTALVVTSLSLGWGLGAIMAAKYAAAELEGRRLEARELQTRLDAEAEKNAYRLEVERAWARTTAEQVDLPAERRIAEGDPSKRYILAGPKPGVQPPPEGFRLVVVLPGGDGGEDFRAFVMRIHEYALRDEYLVAQPIAPIWSAEQFDQIVWPTETSPWPGMEFSTEELVESVVRDVATRFPLDPRYVFALGWSSGGPPCYALSLRESKVVRGFVIAMSVFRSDYLPPLERARGNHYALIHSPDDQLALINNAYRAHDALLEHGAQVHLIEYPGGHGWRDRVYADLREGFVWLERAALRWEAGGPPE